MGFDKRNVSVERNEPVAVMDRRFDVCTILSFLAFVRCEEGEDELEEVEVDQG